MAEEREKGEAGEVVSVFALEHEPAIDPGILSSLYPWERGERERMASFKSPSALTSFCLARLLARKICAALCGKEEAELRFREAEGGKPYLDGRELSFNWSHAAGCALLAVSRSAELGVDVEGRSRDAGEDLSVARRFFSPAEASWIAEGGEAGRAERFLSIFVQKEAALKMTGEGLSGSLRDAPAFASLPPRSAGDSALFYAGGNSDYIAAVRARVDRPLRFLFSLARYRGAPEGFPGLAEFRPFRPFAPGNG